MPSFDDVFPTHSHNHCSPISGTFVGGPIGVHLDVGWAMSSMAASVAANCWSLDIDLETSVMAHVGLESDKTNTFGNHHICIVKECPKNDYRNYVRPIVTSMMSQA